MNEIQELRANLKAARKAYRDRWMEDPACLEAYTALAAYMQALHRTVDKVKLGELYGSKDRGTINALLNHRVPETHKVVAVAQSVTEEVPADVLEDWSNTTAPAVVEGSRVTVTVPDTSKLNWISGRPTSKQTTTTWQDGIKVDGEEWLHRELKIGKNSYLQSLVDSL